MAGKETEKRAAEVNVPAPYVPGMSWADLTVGSDQVMGSDLASGELLDTLIGVPFAIYRVSFYPGAGRTTAGKRRAFVSCEAIVADADTLKRRRVNTSELPFEAEASIVFNDGSTGVYRQIVAYLHAVGFVTLPEGAENGSETRYDLPPSEWESVNAGDAETDADGFLRYTTGIRLVCPRGLRKSEYTNDYGDAETRYLG